MSNYTPTYFSRELTALLRGLIARYQVSQEVLAIACDMSQSQFSKVIRGVRPMTLDHFAAICDTLGHDMDDVLLEVTARITEYAITASPVTFSEHGERLAVAQPSGMKPDPWAESSKERFAMALPEVFAEDLLAQPQLNVRGETQDDYAAAASERDGIDETDEGFN